VNQPLQPERHRRRWWQSRRSIQMDQMKDLLVGIDAALVVRDPGNARSVDAYDGLRKQVTLAAGDRRRLLVMLSELSESLRLEQSPQEIESKAEEWMLQSGLVRLMEADSEEAFEVVGTDTGTLTVISPAYVDAQSGFIIRRGIAERSPLAPAIEPASDACSDQLAVEAPSAGDNDESDIDASAEVEIEDQPGPDEETSS
jgi:hypothetical protein